MQETYARVYKLVEEGKAHQEQRENLRKGRERRISLVRRHQHRFNQLYEKVNYVLLWYAHLFKKHDWRNRIFISNTGFRARGKTGYSILKSEKEREQLQLCL